MGQGNKSNVLTWVLVAVVVGLIAINIAYVLHRDSGARASVGEKAPNFTLPVLNPADGMDDEVELAALEGKAVLLEFFMTT